MWDVKASCDEVARVDVASLRRLCVEGERYFEVLFVCNWWCSKTTVDVQNDGSLPRRHTNGTWRPSVQLMLMPARHFTFHTELCSRVLSPSPSASVAAAAVVSATCS